MKRCLHCQETKPESEFNRNKGNPDGLKTWCRACDKAWYQAHRSYHIAKARQNNIRYKLRNTQRVQRHLATHPCVDCGEIDLVVLTFDHLPGHKKAGNVSDMRRYGVPQARLIDEIKKCEVVCCNCHARRTALRRTPTYTNLHQRYPNSYPNYPNFDLLPL
jgi:hypothetical protein